MAAGRHRRIALAAATTLLFAACLAMAVTSSAAVAAMGEIPMPGGWAMSAMWLPMCGQTWTGTALSFLGMWTPMMTAMMLPSLAPVLRHYGQTLRQDGETRPEGSIILAGLGYFCVWTAIGGGLFPFGAALATAAIREPALAHAFPVAAAAVVLGAGALQFTAWKARRLADCRAVPARGHAVPEGAFAALRLGLRHGCHCAGACAGPTAVLVVFGMANLPLMAAVAVAVTAERLAPKGECVAHAVGAVLVGAGAFLVARLAGIG